MLAQPRRRRACWQPESITLSMPKPWSPVIYMSCVTGVTGAIIDHPFANPFSASASVRGTQIADSVDYTCNNRAAAFWRYLFVARGRNAPQGSRKTSRSRCGRLFQLPLDHDEHAEQAGRQTYRRGQQGLGSPALV